MRKTDIDNENDRDGMRKQSREFVFAGIQITQKKQVVKNMEWLLDVPNPCLLANEHPEDIDVYIFMYKYTHVFAWPYTS